MAGLGRSRRPCQKPCLSRRKSAQVPVPSEPNLVVETSLGPVWFWGRDTGRPILLLVHGIFSEPGVFDRMQSVLSDVDVLSTYLPGHQGPPLVAQGVGPWAAALSLALKAQFGWRRCAVVGLSIGALPAMAIDAPNVMRVLLIEPVLRTAHLWPLAPLPAKARTPAEQEILWVIFGVSATQAREERDYSHLLDRLATPGRVLVGAIPLGEPRDLAIMPSLVDDADRARLAGHPHLELTVAAGAGHDVARESMAGFFESVLEACQAL